MLSDNYVYLQDEQNGIMLLIAMFLYFDGTAITAEVPGHAVMSQFR